MKLIIAGGRDFDDYNLLTDVLSDLYEQLESCNRGCCSDFVWKIGEVVSGKASGADSLGERFAASAKIPVTEFPADWNKYGNAAGPIRNKQMGDYADELLAFWDGKSKGTKHMIDYMTSLGKPVWVRMYKK
jgi:hypothetical protein